MPFATAPSGVRLHYRALGHGPVPVVLLQGLGLSGSFWFGLPAALAGATPNTAALDVDGASPYRVLVPDNRGTGRSDRPRRPYPIGAMADDVAAVLDAEGIAAAYVVGISLGGMVAQSLALRHPARVRGLVLLATVPGLPHARLPNLRATRRLLALPFLRGDALAGLGRVLLSPAAEPRASELLADWPAMFRAEPRDPSTYGLQLVAALTHLAGTRSARIRCPVHVIVGEGDQLIAPRNAERLHRLLPDATLERLPAVGHGIPLEDPLAVARGLARLRRRADARR